MHEFDGGSTSVESKLYYCEYYQEEQSDDDTYSIYYCSKEYYNGNRSNDFREIYIWQRSNWDLNEEYVKITWSNLSLDDYAGFDITIYTNFNL